MKVKNKYTYAKKEKCRNIDKQGHLKKTLSYH
jgi:hypothetical protein